MPFTYTYTARSKRNPRKVITFTIFDAYVKVNLTGLFDQITSATSADDVQEELKSVLSEKSSTTLIKILENLSGPVHINDVAANLENGEFSLTFWERAAGLRVAPITINMGEVDNPQAASVFIEKLQEQQNLSERPGVFPGFLDYWLTWFGVLIGLLVLIRRFSKRKS